MAILCRLGQHQAAALVRANAGARFGRCLYCGCDLILAATGWRAVPRGYRIVWRNAPPEHAVDPAQLPLALPELAWPPERIRRIARPAAPPPRPRPPRRGFRPHSDTEQGRVTV